MPTVVIDGKPLWVPADARFYVQVRRIGGRYKGSIDLGPNLAEALIHYNGINTDDKHVKRLSYKHLGRYVTLVRSGL